MEWRAGVGRGVVGGCGGGVEGLDVLGRPGGIVVVGCGCGFVVDLVEMRLVVSVLT